jgi:TRAP-type C4-dicarboxylate transport system permease small subunit
MTYIFLLFLIVGGYSYAKLENDEGGLSNKEKVVYYILMVPFGIIALTFLLSLYVDGCVGWTPIC